MRLASSRATALLVATWLAMSTANLWSVARFRPQTALTFTVALPALLAVVALSRRGGLAVPPRLLVSSALVGVAVVVEAIVYYSYLSRDVRELCMHLVAGTAVACALLWALPHRRAHDVALVLAGACLVATTWLIIGHVPAPRIDVWYSLDQGSSGLLDGRNPYATTFVGGPGVADAFTYLPMTLVVLAPFQWLLGDVRWGLLVALLLAGWLLTRLGRPRGTSRGEHTPYDARGAVLLLWLTPGQLAQSEQSWTEPLLLALLVALLWCVERRHGRAAVAVLAVALATKQHIALLLPTLALWRLVGARRVAVAVVGGGLLCLPWFLWGPADFWHDTVTLLLGYPPLPRSPNLYIWLYRSGIPTPYWLPGLAVLAALVGTAVAVRRSQPRAGRLALWWAVLLLVVNLVNKQAFYNQFWLVGALLLVSLAATGPAEPAAPRQSRTCQKARLASPR